jgi:hypothetical protein
MSIIEMIEDYARRAPTRLTPRQIAQVTMSNHVITGDDCFIVYREFLDEIHILFPYAAKGKTMLPLYRALEAKARKAGFRRIEMTTNRPKAIYRLFPDAKAVGITFVKELI